MSTMTTLQLAIGALTLLTNAFFVGAEFALISVRRGQIEPRAQEGNKRARMTLWGLEHLSAMLATAQLGITVSSLVLGAVAEPAIAHLLEPAFEAVRIPDALVHPVAFVIALSVATYLHMLLGEMIPKNIALAAPERSALLFGPPAGCPHPCPAPRRLRYQRLRQRPAADALSRAEGRGRLGLHRRRTRPSRQ